MLFTIIKITIAALVIAFASWLAGKKPEMAGLNHPGGVMVHYFLKEKPETNVVEFTIEDKDLEPIKKLADLTMLNLKSMTETELANKCKDFD